MAMPNRVRGFSLLELMITITVMAILLAIAVPNFRDVIHRNQVSSASNAMLAAAMALLNATPVTGEGRRIAVLGDMLELGDHSAKLHAALADLIVGTGTQTVFLGGPEMRALAEALPSEVKTEYRAGVEDLKPVLLAALQPGDVVMIKSSKGIGFAKLVDALLGKFPAESTTSKQT